MSNGRSVVGIRRIHIDIGKLRRFWFVLETATHVARQPKERPLHLRSNIALAISLSLLATDGALAQAPAAAPATQPLAAGPPTQAPVDQQSIDVVAKKLCRGEPVVGTRIAFKRKCDTPAQLAYYQRQAREIIEDYKRRPCMAGAESGENKLMPC